MSQCVVMSCISCRGTWVVLILPSVSLAPFSQSLMWRIGGWVEGQVLPPPRSPLTSYCCPVRWLWHFEIYFNFIWLWIQYFGLLWKFYFCCHFWWVFFVFFYPKDIKPHLCFIRNNFSSHGKIYCPHFPSLHSFAIASLILLFAWPSAIFERSLFD